MITNLLGWAMDALSVCGLGKSALAHLLYGMYLQRTGWQVTYGRAEDVPGLDPWQRHALRSIMTNEDTNNAAPETAASSERTNA